MSRRVPRTLRTLKLDYREIAALLLFPPAFLDPVVLPLLLCLLQLLILRPFPYRSCRRCRSSSVEYLFPALRRFFGPLFLLPILLREAPLRPASSRVPRVLPVVRRGRHRYGRRNLLPGGGPARPRRWESASAMPSARVRACAATCACVQTMRRYDDTIRDSRALAHSPVCGVCVSVSPTQLTARRDGAG